MTESKSIWRRFPGAFWAANCMEIFERMGWYGFYAVSSLYLTGETIDGGLGLSSEDRGVIQGLATFFLYLFPALFGALADRYGFKKMFLASCGVMIPGYLLLGIPHGFWGFLAVYFLVAVGHGMFKPVVISTVAKSTTEETGSMGFGIFYMMVNIGGFLGPIVAGIVRGWDWQFVFYCSAGWIALMGVITLIFYHEPPRDVAKESQRSLSEVFAGMVEVVGNGRFFLLVAGLLLILVMGSKWLPFSLIAPVALGWLAVNLLLDLLIRRSGQPESDSWWARRMQVGEGRYLIFLLLMAGFWTSFNQIFMTLPEYIRDYVDTSDLIRTLTPAAAWVVGVANSLGLDTTEWGRAVLEHEQVKPEHLINLNALGIIIGQVAIAYMVRKLQPLTTIIAGSFITVLSFLLYLVGQGGWIIVIAVLVFSVGEMLASPRSKEYAGRIAPPEKVGMYMGYFYWCVALGNLFGGLLSGVTYQHFGPVERGGVDQPSVMWLIFAGLALMSALLLWGYNRWVQDHPVQD
ncbi:MAG: MFS transporter [bacterium]